MIQQLLLSINYRFLMESSYFVIGVSAGFESRVGSEGKVQDFRRLGEGLNTGCVSVKLVRKSK